MANEYPLSWPDNWPRTQRPQSSQFRTTLAGALKNVRSSVEAFSRDSGHKVTGLVISSNVTLGSQKPGDPGVAVYFTWDNITTCIPVDRYNKVECNLQAIHHVLEAERTKLRHGGLNLVRAAFRGYAALPPPEARENWMTVLRVDRNASSEDVRQSMLRLRAIHHPDKGGDPGVFNDIQNAWEAAKKHFKIKA